MVILRWGERVVLCTVASGRCVTATHVLLNLRCQTSMCHWVEAPDKAVALPKYTFSKATAEL